MSYKIYEIGKWESEARACIMRRGWPSLIVEWISDKNDIMGIYEDGSAIRLTSDFIDGTYMYENEEYWDYRSPWNCLGGWGQWFPDED